MEINPQNEIDKIIDFIKTTFKSQGYKKAIVAVSGGLDSTVTLSLAVKALGTDNVYSLQLPYKRQSTYLSTLIIDHLEIPQSQRLILKLSRSVDKLAIKLNARKDKLRFGNILARARMVCLFDQAKAKNALVIGTENKSENLLGYYTRYGDQASDLDPISHLYKTQVIALAKELSLPEKIISAPPSAELWKDQTDEKELGFSYQQADPILEAVLEKKSTDSFDSSLVDKILDRLQAVDFKTKVPYHL
jgi:NAD+ synthase